MLYEYEVRRFFPAGKKNPGQQAAEQLQELIAQFTAAGYEYVRIDQVTHYTPPGCLPGLFGAHERLTHIHLAIFRRRIQ
jgi:hypothetical protein